MMGKILVIEDDDNIRANVLDLLEAEGFIAIGANDGKLGVELAVRQLPALIICDVMMPGIDGFEVLEILSMKPATAAIPFIFLSARIERADVRRGMALGADDYITKPFTRSELLDAIHSRLKRVRTLESAAEQAARSASASPAAVADGMLAAATRGAGVDRRSDPIVADPAMRALFAQIERIAPAPISVLILGETGVGKEVIAEHIHRSSGRRGRFVALNCAALPENLLESELFGHEKGAFTGAHASKEGLFESADGGTVFLDEVGDLPAATQVKLLRVLEDRKVLRVGGRSARSIDVRFLSATNRDIESEVTHGGSFRQDLYFRLNGMAFHVPALRDRLADIAPLARAFALASSAAIGRSRCPELSAETLAMLERYDWPGNIRELRNVIERAVLLCDGARIDPAQLPAKLAGNIPAPPASEHASAPPIDPRARLLGELERLDRDRIVAALARCAGNQTEAAEQLGISRRTLVNRLHTYNLPRPRKRPVA
jgi:two-component system, NtrC family, response regulator AtoC